MYENNFVGINFAHNFEEALRDVKSGARIQRKGWNDKNMFVHCQRSDEHSEMSAPYLYIKFPNGWCGPWVPSQADLFAEDWGVF